MGQYAIRRVSPLWFRRWSRKGAAVFHSLHTVVLIARLSSSVLSSLSRKTLGLSLGQGVRSMQLLPEGSRENEDDEANDPIGTSILLPQAVALVVALEEAKEGQVLPFSPH
ncbi:MAG: hypothetical protein Q4A61_00290 [Porphyromonadaceae bacterium]|nr:hypothetical protein [Porphyromonadaceae bacterium]